LGGKNRTSYGHKKKNYGTRKHGKKEEPADKEGGKALVSKKKKEDRRQQGKGNLTVDREGGGRGAYMRREFYEEGGLFLLGREEKQDDNFLARKGSHTGHKERRRVKIRGRGKS